MKLQEIFDQLANGEFSQLSVGGAAAGVINESNYSKVLGHVNLGMMALYKRFLLKEGRVTLKLLPDVETYSLGMVNAVSNRRSTVAVRFLMDSTENPYLDDIQKIEKVLTSCGYELGLNDHSDMYGVFTPSAATLRVPKALVNGSVDLPDEFKTETLEIVYRAKPAKLTVPIGYFDPNRVEVELPDSHLEPLLYFVASRVQTPIGMTDEFNASNNYYAKFLAACADIDTSNLRIDQGSQNTRLKQNGWV